MAASASPYKPRKKKKGTTPPRTTNNEIALPYSKAASQSPAFPLVAFFWPARKNTSQWVILPLVLMIVGLYRWCAGLWGYSGMTRQSNPWPSANVLQAFKPLRCTAIMKPKDTGWRLPPTSRSQNGTFTTSSIGAWTTHP